MNQRRQNVHIPIASIPTEYLRGTMAVQLLCSILLFSGAAAFNLDTSAASIKLGPPRSYFGYSVAQHVDAGGRHLLLVGAVRANSSQPGTEMSGGLYSCPVDISGGCAVEQVEYRRVDPEAGVETDGYELRPNETRILGVELHASGKHGQLLGAALSSVGDKVVVCAPLLRFAEPAYTEGVCYVLDAGLQLTRETSTCLRENKNKRHNSYGACLDGFSAVLDKRIGATLLATGAPGVSNWIGGASVTDFIGHDRKTLARRDVPDNEFYVEQTVPRSSYLGYSIRVGRFGLGHESPGANGRVTVAVGAPRYNSTGAVVFTRYHAAADFSDPYHNGDMYMLHDAFVLTGRQLASGFGYAVEAVDLDSNGQDDLIVSAPFGYGKGPEPSDGASGQRNDAGGKMGSQQDDSAPRGGFVYIYFSRGKQEPLAPSQEAFMPPVELYGPAHSQFGVSLAAIGDVNKDGFQDFAVGAPFARGGGAVYIFHGAPRDKFDKKPAQTILGSSVSHSPPLSTLGWSLSGGADADGNGYPDILVGAFMSDAAVLLRSRPIVHVSADVDFTRTLRAVDKDDPCEVASWAHTCFDVFPTVRVRRAADSIDAAAAAGLRFDRRHVFVCHLDVVAAQPGVPLRATFDAAGAASVQWDCGRDADKDVQVMQRTVYLKRDVRDWLHPLKFNFWVELASDRRPPAASQTDPMPNLDTYPVLDKKGAEKEFLIRFDKKCGNDNLCETDLQVQCTLPNLARDTSATADSGTPSFIKQVGTDDRLDVLFEIDNRKERAYEAMLYVNYDAEELDRPRVNGGVSVIDEGSGTDLIIYSFGNPFRERGRLVFELSFNITRGKQNAIGRPLRFSVHSNSTSKDVDMSNNNCSAQVRVIKEAEIELVGVSFPSVPIYYGGPLVGESAMKGEWDIGPMVEHRYTVTNEGPWSVNNVSILIDWPYEVQAPQEHGKWALYLMEKPVIRTSVPGSRIPEIRYCSVELPAERINPLGLEANTLFALDKPEARLGRQDIMKLGYEEALTPASDDQATVTDQTRRSPHRIRPVTVTEISGETVQAVVISCRATAGYSAPTAKCFPIRCHLPVLDKHTAANIDIRARLWNSTFVEDYRDVDHVRIESTARVILDPAQGIKENRSDNNADVAATRAQPDLPKIRQPVYIPIWIIILAILIALFILCIIAGICWKCGWFERKRRGEGGKNSGSPRRYRADYHRAEITQTAT